MKHKAAWAEICCLLLAGCSSSAAGPGESVTQVVCGSGTTLVDGVCRANDVTLITCGAGTVLSGAQCVAESVTPTRSCGSDTNEVSGVCVGTPPRTCAVGTVESGSECVVDDSGFEELAAGFPASWQDPRLVPGDLYMFKSPDAANTVTVLATFGVWLEPASGARGASFAPDARYQLNFDNNGDAIADIVYRFEFHTILALPATAFFLATNVITVPTSPALALRQVYDVVRVDIDGGGNETSTTIATNLAVAPPRIGSRTMGTQANYEALAAATVLSVNPVLGGQVATHRLFAGVRDDPAFVDEGALNDLLDITRTANLTGDPNAQVAVDHRAGFNVNAIALQLPVRALANGGQVPANADSSTAVVGAWVSTHRRETTKLSATARAMSRGPWIQVARVGLPLVRDWMIPWSERDAYDRAGPDDIANLLPRARDPEASRAWNALYGISVPAAPRDDILRWLGFLYDPAGTLLAGTGAGLTTVQLPAADMLRLNLATPSTSPTSRLGVIAGDVNGFPNGRRLRDDVVDITERVVAGGVTATGFDISPNNILNDGVIQNDVPFLAAFPFLATPHAGFDRIHQ